MPGYLSNRKISLIPALKSELDALNISLINNVSTINTTITEIQGDVEDLQLNIGV